MVNDARKRNREDDILVPPKNGSVLSDDKFDLAYLPSFRKLSRRYWTPVKVACRAAVHLATEPGTRILDVGSGVGKFCILGAMTTSGTFVGIEQRKRLLDEAERVREQLSVERVEFIHGNMADLDWSEFDAFYLYNPFFENIVSFAAIDMTIPIRFELYDEYVTIVREKLRPLPIGTKVATYHGFGGKVPDCYDLACRERIGSDQLNIWIKARDAKPMDEEERASDELEWDVAGEG